MEYETVIIYDDEADSVEIISERYPIDFVSGSPMTDPNIAPVATRVRTKRYTGRIRTRRLVNDKSPSQDMTLARARQIPKTLGDTNEFISAFWINGKPKCREGYRYDFRRKMCRRI